MPASSNVVRIAASVLCAALLAGAQMEDRPDPAKFPARTTNQKVTIAVVPVFDTPEAERIFGPGSAPTKAGFLAVEFMVWNDRDKTIELMLDGATIYSSSGQFERVGADVIALTLFPKPEQEAEDPTRQEPRPRFPIPLPRREKKPPKDENREQREAAEATLRYRELRSGQVAAGGFVRGYLYFDLRGSSIDPAEAAVFVPGGKETDSDEVLLFMEISLRPFE